MNPAHLILAVCDIKKQTQRKCNQDSIIAQTKFTGLLEVWELYMPDFSVKQFVERANTMLERWDGAILNAGIYNVRSCDVLFPPLLKKTTKLLPPYLGTPQYWL
ncbi:hypothetical protein B0H13DRAFT_1885993 [Mycena leptocephala]|nr:hypothetical protein B0H13DRAFT_1885993 [Mycena leptocephala]